VDQLLPGSPIADKIPLARVVQVRNEDQQPNPRRRQQNRRSYVQSFLHWLVSVPGNLSGTTENVETDTPIGVKSVS
jgi:hypothetical protein